MNLLRACAAHTGRQNYALHAPLCASTSARSLSPGSPAARRSRPTCSLGGKFKIAADGPPHTNRLHHRSDRRRIY